MKSLIGLLLTLVAVNGAFLGANKCSTGPSYWCTSFQKAKDCGATHHCVENVWRNLKAKTSELNLIEEPTQCTFCKDIITDVTKFLENNATWTDIRKYLTLACSFMPDEYSKKKCNNITEHYLEEFINLIDSNLDPETICQLVKLCEPTPSAVRLDLQNAVVEQQALKPSFLRTGKSGYLSKAGDSDFCADCKTFVAKAKTALEDKQKQAELKKVIEDACVKFGGQYATECETFVTSMFDKVVQAIDAQLTDDPCVKLHACGSLAVKIDVPAFVKSSLIKIMQQSSLKKHLFEMASGEKDGKDGTGCTTCEEVVNYIKLFANNNQTEQSVQKMLDTEVCEQLAEFASMCKEAVEQYLPQLWAEFIHVLDPQVLCTDIGLCNKTSTSVVRETAPVLPKVRASVQCVLCEFIMEKLEQTIIKNSTEAEITAEVEKVCSILPASIGKECHTLIEKYGKAIIHLLISDVAPSAICSFLGLCSSGDSIYMAPLSRGGSENCIMCELVISYVKSMISDNATQEEIMNTLEKVCNFLSGKDAQECNTMVKEDGPKLLNMIANSLDNDKICARIGLCTPQASTAQADGLVHLYNRRSDNV